MQVAITSADIQNLQVSELLRKGIDSWVAQVVQDTSWDELSKDGGTGYIIVLDKDDNPAEAQNLGEIYKGGSTESDWIGNCSQCFLEEDLLFEYVDPVEGGYVAVNIVSDEGWGVSYFIPDDVYENNEDVRNRIDAELP
jgi:hypothetical protein